MSGRPNIIWLTLESTRADHTSLGGYERDTTPNLRRISTDDQGRTFKNCFSHGIWTLPSSASILTGTYPTHHGTGFGNSAIPQELATAPELFGELGYHTACLSPNSHLSSGTALDRGFDDFAWIGKSTLLETVGLPTVLKYVLNIRRHGGGLTTDTKKHGTGFLLQDMAKRWLRSLADDQPFFFYAHYGDPHHPYYPPLPYLDRYADEFPVSPKEAGEIAVAHHEDIHELTANGCGLTPDEWEALRGMYDAEIAYVDDLVGELYDFVKGLDIGETVFVVTADHGEFFGEQGLLGHTIAVDDAVTHVPLVVHGFDDLLNHDGELVQHIDVMQTLLSSVGGDTEQMQGIDLTESTRDYAISQRGAERCEQYLERYTDINPDFDTSDYHSGNLSAIRTLEFKYLRSDNESELFRLPDEETDVSERYPEVVEFLDTELGQWLDTTGASVTSESVEGNFTEAMEEQLADLGYL